MGGTRVIEFVFAKNQNLKKKISGGEGGMGLGLGGLELLNFFTKNQNLISFSFFGCGGGDSSY